jgi:hypothetical protein
MLATDTLLLLTSDLFLQPKDTLRIGDVELDCITAVGAIENVANICHPAYVVDDLIRDYLDRGIVHLLITVEESRRDGGLGDIVPKLPLHIMIRRKCWIYLS